MVASDPGLIRLRLGATALLGIVVAVAALAPFGLPLTVLMVGAIAAMLSAFTVNDPTPGAQAVTLVLVFVAGGLALTVASLGSAVPPLDSIVFVLLIFVAVFAQRWGSRGIALGSATFFLFFFAMFLQTHLTQVPTLLVALAVGVAANALIRFAVLPRRPAAELLRVRRAFRARLAAVVRAAQGYLESAGSDRANRQLRRAANRMHECVLMIEDTAPDVIDEAAADTLRRRAIEVELAVEWFTITVRRTCVADLDAENLADLIGWLRRLGALIERDPRELPVISETGEFSEMLVRGSKLGGDTQPGDQLRRAIAQLALADVNAQRVAEHTGEPEETDKPEPEPKPWFDNTTRSAIQAVVGGGLAVIGGELVSSQRWYWAVLTVFVVFLGTASAGATVVKGMRRLAGTLVGLFGGVLAALLVAGNTPATLVLLLLCVFGMVYTARVSQVVMAFFITSMLGLLYSLLGTFSLEVLWIRLAETAVGAAAGMIAALLVLPIRTQAALREDVNTLLEDLREFTDRARGLLTGTENVDIVELSRNLDRDVDKVRTTIEPLTHPTNVSSARRDHGWHVLGTCEAIGFRARHVAARAQPGLFAGDDAFTATMDRLRGSIDDLLTEVRSTHPTGVPADRPESTGPPAEKTSDPVRRSLLSSLDQLDAELAGLGRAFGRT
ncbi:FUSC family protein [Amycolatopsis suaedae]|uniref:FUSC family protein n=1 Tax=Amycolatopsis suaedae TaxID=2510978 RepID=A0A4Q7JGE0_9PSEU|nr:FUSC family protein [Amycolatopsis suaedae]